MKFCLGVLHVLNSCVLFYSFFWGGFVGLKRISSLLEICCLFPGAGRVEDEPGPPVVPFSPFFLGEGSPTKTDYRKNGYPFSPTGGPSQVSLEHPL